MSDAAYNESPAMMAARGQTYGERKQQMDAQRAVPMGRTPTDVSTQPKRRTVPMTPLSAPTTRPDEPITAGAPFGAGVGPAAAGIPMMPSAADSAVRELRMIAQMFPSDELTDLLDSYESQQ